MPVRACGECGRNPCSAHQRRPGRALVGGIGGGAGRSTDPASTDPVTNGMVCSTWGPPRWFSLHMATFGYPVKPSDEHKKNMKQLIFLWEYDLPCCCCRSNYRAHLKNVFKEENQSEILASRESMIQFGFALHNAVNAALGKATLGEEDLNRVRRMYESCRAGRTDYVYAHTTLALRYPEDVQKQQIPIMSIDNRCVIKPCCVIKP